ncbi:hypothetical protein NA56DRAFT_652673 [Hyaloscypha hepaticicola]|uniref:Uncharacterized protein n=1 Tax=Hyaloscypha hepaticicola TaxID=2082293 RepID=A0A2J6PDU8_9HELO|nr:hypothetical protein NA56DRAFT_652673 [Hyaloscypha hepaticicola]
MGRRQYSNDLQSTETGPRTFLDYNWIRKYIQERIVIRDERENDWNAWLYYWAEIVDELERGSKKGEYCNRGTKNNP